jgi:hypothetical protein
MKNVALCSHQIYYIIDNGILGKDIDDKTPAIKRRELQTKRFYVYIMFKCTQSLEKKNN